MQLVKWAHDLAESLLADSLPRRWAHSQRVYSQALTLAPALGEDAELLAAAAIVHDVGYARAAVDTGQHMIDGARYLRDVVGADLRLCSIVAFHTSSSWEASELGLDDALAEFGPTEPELVDAITYCDLTSTPAGGLVDPAERLSEVLERYGPEHVVFRAVSAARPELMARVARVRRRRAEVVEAKLN
ncbi:MULTISPECIES: HD domain-containing protein [unclassified Streptomyces]|uniref:HD domain-containing protein n=1 Tax=unclassified Streptomyces TaxID=2593676 RepID=UPI001164B558|nr:MULTISPECIES: HD domain-containing protein [unclassified Streptomyces]QDN90139.1 HD domain-containing protein [Streptomyces sp. RLB3-6]QDO10986.1 HD domain-containing protein [Streptomyces sp. S1D4-23]